MRSLLLAGAAAGEAPAHAACRHCRWQELPLSRHRRVPVASSVAGRNCRRRDLSVCHLHALLLAGAAAFKASTHSVCIHCCWQVLPPARPHRMLLACIVAGRSGRRRGLSACRLQPLLLAGAAAGEQRAHAPCIHCCWQEKPPVKPQHMLLAGIVACRSCRRRGTSACRLHALLLAGLPPARPQRKPLAWIVSGRSASSTALEPVGGAVSLYGLARLYGSKGAYDEAEPLSREALRIMEALRRMLSASRPRTATPARRAPASRPRTESQPRLRRGASRRPPGERSFGLTHLCV